MTSIDRCNPDIRVRDASAVTIDTLAALSLATAIATHAASRAIVPVWVVWVLIVCVSIASLSGPGDLLAAQLPVVQAAGG